MYTIFSKPGCAYCERAKKVLESNGKRWTETICESIDELRNLVGPFYPAERINGFPFIVGPHAKIIGSFDKLRDTLEEMVLVEDTKRFSIFPIRHDDIFRLYQKALATFWSADEIQYRSDAADFANLSKDQQFFIKMVLGFFSSSDGIVNEHIVSNMFREIQLAESRQFLAYQSFNEAEHSRTYAMLIDALVPTEKERQILFDGIREIKAIRRKAEWAMHWLDPTRRFAERLIAFYCVEGIMFSGSFCAIFWLKTQYPGKLQGLSLSNQFISRDENLHCQHAALLYRKLLHKLSNETLRSIVVSAVEAEKEFCEEAIPVNLIGMNARLMQQYIEFVADQLVSDLGHTRIFGSSNPFSFMEHLSLEGKTNFFEARVSEYSKAGIMEALPAQFSIDEDF
jgi:ribonucleoside-diphosphate reductase beta chain